MKSLASTVLEALYTHHSSSSQIILANGAQSKNVFWAVGSSATLGTSSVFKGK